MHDALVAMLVFMVGIVVVVAFMAAFEWVERKLDPEGMTTEEHAARANRRQFEAEVRRVVASANHPDS